MFKNNKDFFIRNEGWKVPYIRFSGGFRKSSIFYHRKSILHVCGVYAIICTERNLLLKPFAINKLWKKFALNRHSFSETIIFNEKVVKRYYCRMCLLSINEVSDYEKLKIIRNKETILFYSWRFRTVIDF